MYALSASEVTECHIMHMALCDAIGCHMSGNLIVARLQSYNMVVQARLGFMAPRDVKALGSTALVH